jgi:hypothetical protein
MIFFPKIAAIKRDKIVAAEALKEMYLNTPAPGKSNVWSK